MPRAPRRPSPFFWWRVYRHLRPRWQYLAIAGCWATVAAVLAVTSSHADAGWLARTAGAAAAWFAAFCLAMLGRAVARGRVRDLFWWYRPRWVPDGAMTWLTPPPAPAVRGRKRLADG